MLGPAGLHGPLGRWLLPRLPARAGVDPAAPAARASTSTARCRGSTLRAEGYFAVTSNTVQLGGYLEAGHRRRQAAARTGSSRWTRSCSSRRSTRTRTSAPGFEVEVFGLTFCGIRLDGIVDGPGPVTIHGRLTVETFLHDFHFDETFSFGSDERPAGGSAGPGRAGAGRSRRSVRRRSRPVGRARRGRSSRRGCPCSRASRWSTPRGGVAWQQKRVPLTIPIDRLDGAPLGGTQTVNASVPHQTGGVDDLFAPGSFITLTQAQALNRPPFESAAGRGGLGGRRRPSRSAAAAVDEAGRLSQGARRAHLVPLGPPRVRHPRLPRDPARHARRPGRYPRAGDPSARSSPPPPRSWATSAGRCRLAQRDRCAPGGPHQRRRRTPSRSQLPTSPTPSSWRASDAGLPRLDSAPPCTRWRPTRGQGCGSAAEAPGHPPRRRMATVTALASFLLAGPADVSQLHGRADRRPAAPPGCTDNAEATMMAHVELDAPDLPWRYTPEPNTRGRRPSGRGSCLSSGRRPR